MTLTELRYIVALARERHFGHAAEKCHVSQPTLSVALKKVEQRYGVTLFERSSADVRLTMIGEQIAAQAERVLDQAGRLREILVQGKDPLHGPLRLGAIYTIAPYLLPRLIPALHARAPRMPLYLHENFTVNLAAQLRRGDLDVIVVALPFAEPGVVSRVVYEEPFCVVMPKGHPLAHESSIDPARVAAENLLLLGNGNCFRDQVVQACPQLSAPGGTAGALEGSSLETVRYMVASGAGISVVPASAAASWPQEDALLAFRHFSAPAPLRRVVLAWRATFPRPQAIDVLRAAILDAPPPGVAIG
ncbi:MAG: LysR family transcriptional regulator [Candidatus Accumulibacter sp.]|jgi:LysR family hydrogen peroxide-inducible transcriptional activator|uniref:hydrogen peroxide-inducible genes activator n=1 Tax=Accumulibacter sp. TaxID=2053492 RepID=UPI001A5E7851|nr:hydrogen peroxide-inducible genes activator [Accumulibacter sp.]MBL8396370.1 LysR family transcriptional regulator [Accumulibacter sp.]